jgi:CRISPR-associated protein Csb2
MAIRVAVRFPHRQYQATPWDQAVNSGSAEWPPSPWRLVRALLSVRHLRYPDLDEVVLLRLVDQLTGPPEYLLPEVRPGHTRHYLPGLDYRSGGRGPTTKTLAPYLAIDPAAELVLSWPEASLVPDDREVLAKLVASMPYLGRAESVCEARLLDGAEPVEPAGRTEFAPKPGGVSRVLCVESGATLDQMQITPTQMRTRAKVLMPPGARWVSYPAIGFDRAPPTRRASRPPRVTALRWRVVTKAPLRAEYGALVTDRVRATVVKGFEGLNSLDHQLIHGHRAERPDAGRQHRHAHWLWTEHTLVGEVRDVRDVALWVPDGIEPGLVSDILKHAELPRYRYMHRGYVPGELHLLAAGPAETVLADLWAGSAATRWRSVTPYLMSLRMKKGRTWPDLIVKDLARELRFRFGEAAPEVRLAGPPERERALGYRRYRWGENRGDARVGWHLDIELAAPLPGPLVLGGLAHFGFGRFTATETAGS